MSNDENIGRRDFVKWLGAFNGSALLCPTTAFAQSLGGNVKRLPAITIRYDNMNWLSLIHISEPTRLRRSRMPSSA